MKPLEKIQSIFEKYTTSYHFYLRDLRTGEEYELGEKKRYPICSCFKLAVLMAYFDTIKDPKELETEVVISPNKFSAGGGFLNFFTTDVKLTNLQIVQLMISFSDGTATDNLVEKIGGIAKVNQYLSIYTNSSRITSNLNKMVTTFNANLSTLLTSGMKKHEANEVTFKMFVENSDYTNGKDLATLANGTYIFSKSHLMRDQILNIFEHKRFFTRTSTFLQPEMKFIGKSGSLGFGHYMNDCGVIMLHGQPVGFYGYASAGWRHTKDLEETILGIIGLKIANHFDSEMKGNLLYSDITEELLTA